MRSLIPSIGLSVKHKIDYSILPYGVLIMEFAVLTTQISEDAYSSLSNLLLMRIVHTIAMLILAISVGRILTQLKKTELNYLVTAIICTIVIALGDAMHVYLASLFGVELIGLYRRIGIIILQGIIWFPALVIVVSNRQEIINHFKDYELRLISATRTKIRTSKEYRNLQKATQFRIREELYASCHAIKESLEKVLAKKASLSTQNNEIRPLLSGQELRKFSMRLETYKSDDSYPTFRGMNWKSINLFIQQFRILYASTCRTTPLGASTYAFVLLSLVTPAYINYYSFQESLISYPVIVFSTIAFANLIRKVQSSDLPNALRFSSILMFLTGLLPFFLNLARQAINNDPQTKFPILLTAFALPVTYYLFMEALQVLRPRAIDLVRNDELKASSSLQNSVTKIINEEFAHNLSHQWAVFIHGKILTRLAATSLKLETASIAGDSKGFNSTIQSLFTLLKSPDAEFEESSTDLEFEVTSRLNPWIGLLDVKLQIDEDLKTIRSAGVRDLAEVIEELISNSIRHGKSKLIDLRITRSGANEVKIIAIDNATIAPPKLKYNAGLGTRIFNLASDGRWSLKRVGNSTEFRLTMGLEI